LVTCYCTQQDFSNSLLKAVGAHHGIFVERARHIYSFAHLTFQEYFTARYVVDNAARGTLELLVRSHLTNARWREVFLLVASRLDDADTLFYSMLAKLDALARSSESLVTLLAWVDMRARTLRSSQYDPLIVRSTYLALVLSILYIPYTLTFARVSDFFLNLTHTHNQAFALDLTYVRAFVFARDRALIIDQALDHTLDRAFTLALSHPLDFTHALSRPLEFALTRAHNFAYSLEHPLICAAALDIASALDTETFDFLIQFDLRTLGEYLAATQLILDCTRLAYLSDRADIQNCLLLPPQ
jgi:hypothetical protein